MNKNYNCSLQTIVICLVLACISFNINAQVGIGTTAPNSQLDVVNPNTTGNTLELTHSEATNGSSAAWIKNSGTGYGLHV